MSEELHELIIKHIEKFHHMEKEDILMYVFEADENLREISRRLKLQELQEELLNQFVSLCTNCTTFYDIFEDEVLADE